jgi:hypothetical protein
MNRCSQVCRVARGCQTPEKMRNPNLGGKLNPQNCSPGQAHWPVTLSFHLSPAAVLGEVSVICRWTVAGLTPRGGQRWAPWHRQHGIAEDQRARVAESGLGPGVSESRASTLGYWTMHRVLPHFKPVLPVMQYKLLHSTDFCSAHHTKPNSANRTLEHVRQRKSRLSFSYGWRWCNFMGMLQM